MNEVKAFIRKQKTEEVVDALESQGYCCMTLIDVMGLGRMSDPEKSRLSVHIAERYSDIMKLVIVCDAQHTSRVVALIKKYAHSGQPGDGIIYVTPVLESIHIRTGESGSEFLQKARTD